MGMAGGFRDFVVSFFPVLFRTGQVHGVWCAVYVDRMDDLCEFFRLYFEKFAGMESIAGRIYE